MALNDKSKEFIEEIISVCKKHNLSIAHQDTQGAFIIEEYHDENIDWIKDAEINIKLNKHGTT